jgi:2,4-dienoyl-CoA reductase-like NADH-dependent reductase (Old Yellow Enzyme family)
LDAESIDGIELSGGTTDPVGPVHPVRDAADPPKVRDIYYLSAARHFKQRFSIPLILVGGIRSCQETRELLEQHVCDLIALCRPLIQDPHLIQRWASGDQRPSKCDSCNECLTRLRAGKPLSCPLAELTAP